MADDAVPRIPFRPVPRDFEGFPMPATVPPGFRLELSGSRVVEGKEDELAEWMSMLTERYDECLKALPAERAVPRGGEVIAGDFGEQSGCGPDPDSWHARQDGLKKVRINQLLDFRSVASCAASRGSTSAAALVPVTTAVCSLSATTIACAQSRPLRGGRFNISAAIRFSPAERKSCCDGQRCGRSRMAG